MIKQGSKASQSGDGPPIVRLHYKKGDLIVKEGNYGNVLYRIIKGRVRIFMDMNDLLVSLAVLESGEIIGENAYIDQATRPYTFSARAMNECEIEVWHVALLEQHFNTLSPVLKAVFDQPLRRLLRTRNLIQHLTKRKMMPQPEESTFDEADPKKISRLDPVLLDDQGMDTALHKHLFEKRKEWAAQKRRHYRKKVDFKAAYWPLYSEKNIPHASGLIRDLSREGLGMEVLSEAFASFSHDVGDRFEIDFKLSNDQPVHLQAIVVSKREGRLPHSVFLGLYVTHITYENQKRLGFFLMP